MFVENRHGALSGREGCNFKIKQRQDVAVLGVSFYVEGWNMLAQPSVRGRDNSRGDSYVSRALWRKEVESWLSVDVYLSLCVPVIGRIGGE